ncbi:dephospho-CoA kinase [Elusimicrobiota bacterium]
MKIKSKTKKTDKKARQLTVALTGSFGSGKSFIRDCFQKEGAFVLDCDALARDVVKKYASKYVSLVKRLIHDGSGNRRKELAHLIFKDKKARTTLENFMHPKILAEMRTRLKSNNSKIRIVEVPLLFEKRLENRFNASIAVKCPNKLLIKRLKQRGFSAMEVKERLAVQMPEKLKCDRADYILDNTLSRSNLRKKAKSLYKTLESISMQRDPTKWRR